MKKSTKLIVALLVVVAALAVTYRLMHRVPSADLEANAQMQQIITDAGCLRCHTSTPDLPFYASMPVAGKIVMEDVSKAYRAFDMTQMEADLEAGQPLNPADLAKIEKVILDGKMPQAKYYLVHWGASFNDAKKEVALNWVKSHRMGMYTDITVAPEFANEPIRPIADSIAVDVRKVVLGQYRIMCQLPRVGYRRRGQQTIFRRCRRTVWWRQCPDSIQRRIQFRSILGWPCRNSCRTSCRSSVESGGNGLRIIRPDYR